jgi:hypothetical protein
METSKKIKLCLTIKNVSIMATNNISLGINLRQNKNSKNTGFGKYYPEVDTQTTLSLKGFAKHMAAHGCIYTSDIIEGVLKKITQCLPELISQGRPVRLDPLGTFLPTVSVDEPVLNIPAMAGADPNDVVKGVHIRFLPYGVEDEKITSRRFKDEYCTLEFRNIVDTIEVTVNGKTKKMQTLKPIATAVAEWKEAHGESGTNQNQNGSSSSSSSSGSSGSSENQGGNSGSGSISGNTLAAPQFAGETQFTESTQVTISGPDGAEIHYTVDGSTPTAESTQYSEPLTFTQTTTLKAIAIKDGQSSEVTSRTYTKSSGEGGMDQN